MNKRLIVTLGALVVAAGIGFIALRGYPPQQGVEGAIGAANRYSENQITDADVTISDAEIQAFLQSDLFHRMQTDADFRTQVLDNQRVLADAQFMRAIDPLLTKELDAIRTVAADGNFWTVVDGRTVRGLRLDAMNSTIDALSELGDAAMSKIAVDNLPQYFPGNNQVAFGDAWASTLSDGAKSLIGDRAFWGQMDESVWSALVVAAQRGQLDELIRRRTDLNAAELDALLRRKVDLKTAQMDEMVSRKLDRNTAQMDELVRKISKLDMNAAQLDAMRSISDAAMSKIAVDNLPQYFPGNNQVAFGDAWASTLSDGAKSLIRDRAFWGNVGVDGWNAIADAAWTRELDGLSELLDGYGFQLDEANYSLDALQMIADGNRTKLSMDAQRMLADERLTKVIGDRAQALVDASMPRVLDAFAMRLDEARAKMDAGSFQMDAFTSKMDGQVWRSMDAAKWQALDASKSKISDYAMALSSDGFASMVASDGFASRIGDSAYISALTNSDFWSVLSDAQFAQAISDAKFSKFIGTDQFTSALAE